CRRAGTARARLCRPHAGLRARCDDNRGPYRLNDADDRGAARYRPPQGAGQVLLRARLCRLGAGTARGRDRAPRLVLDPGRRGPDLRRRPRRFVEARARTADPGFVTGSETLDHRLGAGHVELTRLLDIERLHHAVIDQHRIALRAGAHAVTAGVELEPHRLGELGAAVGEHHDLAVGLVLLTPGAHDERVVDRDAGDRVDALGLDVAVPVDIAGQVTRRAGRGKRARNRENGDLFAVEQFVGGHLLRAFGRQITEFPGRNLVANLDSHLSTLREFVLSGG